MSTTLPGKPMVVVRPPMVRYLRVALPAVLVAGVLIVNAGAIYQGLVAWRGTEFDFFLVWRGAREIAFGRDPYTDAMAAQIQMGILGRLAGPTENQYHFAYPGFVAFLVFPFGALPFSAAVTLWLMAQELLLGTGLILILRSMHWSVSKRGVALLIVAAGGLRYTLITLLIGQTSILVLFLLASAAFLSSRRKDNLSGVVLSLAMFKPQLVVLPVMGWIVARLAARQFRAVGTFVATIAALLLASFAVIGNWVPGFTRVLTLYRGYNSALTPMSLAASLVPGAETMGVALGTVLTIAYLMFVAVRGRDTLATLSLGVLCTLLVIPLPSAYDIILILLPWLYCLWRAQQRHGAGMRLVTWLLAAMPVVSWLLITLVPALCESFNVPFDALLLDKLVIPVSLLFIFTYIERKGPLSR